MPERKEIAPPRRHSIGARRNPQSALAVLAAARELLAEAGYKGFSIEAVARRAGAGKPTIYRWWPTKADLFVDLYGAEKESAIALPDLGSLTEDLVRFTMNLWAFWRDNPAGRAFRCLIAEAQGSEAALDMLCDKFIPKRTDPPHLMFERAVARGEFPRAELENRLQIWIGFTWFRVLTGRIEENPDELRGIMRAIAGARRDETTGGT